MLVEFCESFNLIIANTWFQRDNGRKVTYMEPGVERGPPWRVGPHAELDFIITPQRWRNGVLRIRFHNEVSFKFRLKLKQQIRTQGRRDLLVYDREKQEVYNDLVSQQRETAPDHREDTMAYILCNSAQRVWPTRARNLRKDYITIITWGLMEDKHQAKNGR